MNMTEEQCKYIKNNVLMSWSYEDFVEEDPSFAFQFEREILFCMTLLHDVGVHIVDPSDIDV